MDDIERVQKRFTRAIPALRNLPYMARLKALSLQTLEHRRIICDLCLCYKLLHGLTDSDLRHGFQFSEYSSTRGHKFKLRSAINRIDVTKFFYSNRIINIWNHLPNDIVNSTTYSRFKSLIEVYDLSNVLIYK